MTQIELEQRLDWACKQLYALKQRVEDLERKRQAYADPEELYLLRKRLEELELRRLTVTVSPNRATHSTTYTTHEPTGETVA